MSAHPRHGTPSTGTVRRGGLIGAGIGAVLLQGVVLFVTVSLGLFWGYWTYLVAVGQAVVALGVIGWLLYRRRPGAALLVPFASAALTAALLGVTWIFRPEMLTP